MQKIIYSIFIYFRLLFDLFIYNSITYHINYNINELF